MTREEAINLLMSANVWNDEERKAWETLVPELAESEDERVRKELISMIEECTNWVHKKEYIVFLEKLKEASKAIEAVEKIDKYIDDHLANAHDMKDSNPDKKYYRGWDDALGEMARILQDVYSNEKQKETGIRWFKSDNMKNPDKPYIDKAGMFYTTDGRMCYASEIEKQKGETLRDFIDNFPYSDEQKEQKHYWKPTETDVALFNKAVTTNNTLTPAERANLDIIRSKFGCCRATNCSGIVQKEQNPTDEQFPPLEGLDAIKAKYYDDGFKNGFDEGVESVKPAEWSEEDEKMFEQVVDVVYDYCPDPVAKYKLKDWLMQRLKSLKPQAHWKPSEEQMEALLGAKGILRNLQYNDWAKILEELYEQLKKLM